MPTVIIVDDDRALLEVRSEMLPLREFSATTPLSAPSVPADQTNAIAVINLNLSSGHGVEIIREFAARGIRCAIMTTSPTCRDAVRAMRLDVVGEIETLTGADVLREITHRLISAPTAPGGHHHPPASPAIRRWASLATRAVDLNADPRTIREWGYAIAVSEGTIRNWCRTAKIPARASLMFARVLRAIAQQPPGVAAEDLLDIVDRRTITKLITKCGGERGQLPRTIAEFINKQRLITNAPAVNEVARHFDGRVSNDGR